MKKFLAVVKREYLTRVKTKMFIFGTFFLPLIIIALYGVIALIFIVRTGDAVRLAVVDQSGKIYDRLRVDLISGELSEEEKKQLTQMPTEQMNQNQAERMKQMSKTIKGDYVVERVDLKGRSIESVKQELEARLQNKDLDAYIIIPPEINENTKVELVARNVSDFGTREQIRNALNEIVRDQRMNEAKIDKTKIEAINKPIDLDLREPGGKKELTNVETAVRWALPFASALLIYILLLTYGQTIMAAVIEEKETRIAEILFSSINSFHLMLGKLIGVSLVALTQLGIWIIAVALAVSYLLAPLLLSGGVQMPKLNVSIFQIILLFVFFVIGYFLYSAIYSLVGSMVTTPQEGGQLALPLIMFLVIGFYLSIPIIRSPESSFAFWISIIPLWSPVLMPVRIMTQMPPLWEIALSILTTAGMGVFLVWLASRVYRVGMLMYGKRASIPEALKWIRQR
jgi:ABC-2 type transport system permease protein